MEQHNTSLGAKLMSILLIAMGIFLGFYAFFANATTWTLPGGAMWDNSNFINQTFWDANPTSGDIITALYGSGISDSTAYSSGRCNPQEITVVALTGGTDTIPPTLEHNTIYILASGNYILSQGITTDTSCVAIVGRGNVKLYSSGYIDAIIWIDVQQNTIFDNIDIDGTSNGLGGNHTPNNYGIKYQGGTQSHTINNIKSHHNNFGIYYSDATMGSVNNSLIYNNTYGIVFDVASQNKVNNTQIYNNSEGIYLENISDSNIISGSQIYNNDNGINISSGHNTDNSIHTSQIYNNQDKGIYLNSGSNNSIIDSQIYNNDNGIYLENSSNNNINNAHIYNNNGNGMLLSNSSYNSINNSQISNSANGIYLISSPSNIINNSQIYNNNIGIALFSSPNNILHRVESYNNNFGIWLNASPNTRYYDILLLFGTGDYIVGPSTSIISGSSSDITGSMLSLNDGVLSTGGTMDCSRIANPITTGGIYLQPILENQNEDATTCSIRGNILSRYGNIANNYRYGSNVLTQKRPVHRNGGIIGLYGTLGSEYDTGRYIGQYGPIGGTFNINNNDGITYTTSVKYYNYITGATSTRLYDNPMTYETYFEWPTFISGYSFFPVYGGTTGIKNILADYSGSNGVFMVMDTIIYDIPDTTPNQFSFVNKTGTEINTLYTSNIITITGMTPGFFTGVSVNAGYAVKNSTQTGQSLTGGNGDVFYIALTSANSYLTGVSATMTIGGVTGNYSVITKAFDCTNATGVSQTECNALVDLYNSTHGSGWYRTGGWLITTDVCTWSGVYCYVIGPLQGIGTIHLTNNNLSGDIPSSFGNLFNLGLIYLQGNTITSIPSSIGNLTHLGFINLTNNKLTSLPSEIGNLTNLLGLWVSINQLTGVPSSIGNLTGLHELFLSANSITSLPTEIRNLTGLTDLELDSNQLTGVPSSIANLTNLIRLYLNNNQLTSLPLSLIQLFRSRPTLSFTVHNNPGLQGIDNDAFNPLYLTGTTISGELIVYENRAIGFTGDSWNGGFIGPQLATGSKIAVSGETGLQNITPLVTIEVGSTTADLVPYTGTFTISIKVNASTSGKELTIYRSTYNDGNTWSINTPDTTCVLDSDKMCTFETNHLSLFTVGSSSLLRDNNNYINKDFWSTGPNTGDIIQALYGSGTETTAYTQNRSGNICNPTTMNVVYATGGLDKLPQQLSGNTIYVLNSGDYRISYASGVWLNSCSAIIGSGHVTLYTVNPITNPQYSLTFYGMLYSSGKNNTIIDNIHLDGSRDGVSSMHGPNDYGISFSHSGSNNTLNNSQFYHIGLGGIFLSFIDYTTINNSQIYSNYMDGILVENSSHTTVNNSQAYNNLMYGITFMWSSYSSVNNSQSYNNNYGIRIDHPVVDTYDVINNSQAYNNNEVGIGAIYAPSILLNNTQAYNNIGHGIYMNGDSNATYYGTTTAFSNGTNIGGLGTQTAGTGSYQSSLGWTTGSLNTVGTMDCSRVTNPKSASGSYFATTPLCNTQQTIGTRALYTPDNYRYGANILTQISPVKWSGSTLLLYGTLGSDYTTGIYIGQYSSLGGTFSINNNAATTNQTGVILYNTIPSATQMRFSHDGLDRSVRESYAATKNWTLSGSMTSTKSVYAQFSGADGLFLTMDTIRPEMAYDVDQASFSPTSSGASFKVPYAHTITHTGVGVLILSGSLHITVSGANWNGKMIAPIQAIGTKQAVLGEIGLPNAGTLYTTIEAGATGTNLLLTTGTFTVKVLVNSGSVGQSLTIYRSNYNDGNSRAPNFPAPTCILDTSKYCTFQTNHMTIFTIMGLPPTVSTGYIYNGTTGNNGMTGYYKGTVDIQAYITDDVGISGATCMYTTGSSRASADYSGTAITGYCYKIGIIGGADLHINFRVQDTDDNQGTGTSKTYIYDGTAPTFTFSNVSVTESSPLLLYVSGASDAGIGLAASGYNFSTDGITRNGRQASSGFSLGTQNEPATSGLRVKVKDGLGNESAAVLANCTRTNVAPTATFTYNNNQIINSPIIWTGIGIDTGAALGYQWYYDASCSSPVAGQTGVNTTVTLAAAGTTGRYVKISDSQGGGSNCTGGIGTWYTSDTTPPVVSTGYIYNGTTGNNGTTGYYVGTVDIRAAVSDDVSISGTTCEYTTGLSSRASANYDGSNCYKTGLNYLSTITINFRVKDTSGNQGTGTSKTYIYDGTAPIFTFNNNSGYECATGTLSIISASDTGVGLSTTPYSFDGSIWGLTTSINIPAQGIIGATIKTGYVRDILANTLSIPAAYTFLNTGVTANNFTGHVNVGSIPRTADRKVLSNANEGNCGSGSITYSGIVTQGTKGTCSVLGNTITYTPTINQTGSDTCTIQIQDNENSIANITVLWSGINTIGVSVVRDNNNFLTSGFWNQNPTSSDIITALYGSGNSGTTYTTTWSGYTFNSCLSGGMNLITTGILPETLSGHTIYVIASGTYNLTANHLIMNDCTALVSSGTVALSGEVFITNKTNIIIDNIGVTNNSYGSYGLLIHDLHNFSIHGARIYNSSYGISFTFSSYGNITNTSIYNNSFDGLSLNNSTHILVDTIYTYRNNLDGINLVSSSGNTFSGVISSGNNRYGIYTYLGDSNNISYSSIYQNAGGGLISLYENNGTFNHIETYNNTGNGMTIQYNSGMLIQNSLFLNNTNDGININHSNTNTISGCVISGSDIGINIDVSNRNTISNSFYYNTSINNPFAIRMNNTTGNTIYNFSGQRDIYEWNSTGLFQYTTYDIATQINNYINLGSYNTVITLTGNALPVSTTFPIYFDQLDLDYGALYGLTGLSVGGDTWDGKLYSPVTITAGTKMAQSGETGTTLLQNIGDTIEIVSGNSYLTMNSGTGILGIYLPSRSTGQYLRILKSVDGSTWTSNSPTAGCTLNSSKLCAFVTTGTIKLFAFGVPLLAFTGTTQAGSTIISGGYYTTGITITFTGNSISGHTLNGSPYTGGTLITGDGQYIFSLSNIRGNTTGITFTIDTTNPSITGTAPTSGAIINNTNNVLFTWAGLDTNMSGYTLYITGTQQHTITTGGITTTLALTNGTYTRYVMATDRAGNTSISIPALFTVASPLLPTMTMVTGNLKYTTTGRYTRDYASIYLWTNKAANYSFTGNFTTPTPPFIGTGLNGGMTGTFTLTTGDGQKNIYLSVTDGPTTTGKIFTVYLDTTAPSIPSLTTPITGGSATGAFSLVWTSSIDTGVGLSGYQYFVSTTGTFGTGIIKSGFTTSTSLALANGEIGTSGTFYRYIKAIDTLGNISTSVIQPFSYSGSLDIVPDQFTLNTLTSVMINRIYGSNTITVAGLSANTQVLASITRGVLYINGVMVGTTGYVQNGSNVKIELVSSSNYSTLVTSTLNIGGVTASFRITTETEAEANNDTNIDITTNLSSTEKLQIVAIFEALRDMYAGVKQDEFLNSFMVMLQSKMNDLGTSNANAREALQYMYDLVDNYRGHITNTTNISTISEIVNGIYTAPNGKKYTITYDSTKKQFTSPNFLTPKYFVTWDSFKYIIDINNPAGSIYLNAKAIKARRGKIQIDGTWQTSPYTAPNHKVFYFFKTMEGQYSSYTFTVEKYFDSLDATKEFVHNANLR